VIDERAVAPVAIHRNQYAAARVLNARAARLPAETAETWEWMIPRRAHASIVIGSFRDHRM